jgi:hypothetical protein
MAEPTLDPQVELAVERMFGRFKEYLDNKLTEFSMLHPTMQVCGLQHGSIKEAFLVQAETIENTRVALREDVESSRKVLATAHTELVLRVAELEKAQRALLVKVTLIIGGIAAAQVMLSWLIAADKL